MSGGPSEKLKRTSFFDKFEKTRAEQKKNATKESTRYVPLETRDDRSCISADVFAAIKTGKKMTEWRGIQMWKDPLTTTIYQTMLWEVKPATIIEIGVFRGGSTLWLADHSAMFGINSRVLALDIDLSLLDPKLDGSENVTFIEGDSNTIEDAFPDQTLKSLPHPWMVIEDSHENVYGLLQHFVPHMAKGDYFVVEDTHPCTVNTTASRNETPYPGVLGLRKMKVLREFCEKHPGLLMVDTRYNDMFGYNGTWNMNGFLRKM